MRFKIISWLLVCVWALVMTMASSLTDTSLAVKLPRWLDWSIHQGMHVFEYAVLGWLMYRALADKNKPSSWSQILIVVSLVLLFSLFDEWHQSFVANRESSLLDVGFDLVGGVIGVAFGFLEK